MLYQSMNTIAVFTTLNVIVLIWLGTYRNPFKSIYMLIRELITSPRFLVLFLAMAGILLVNKYEQQLEQQYFTNQKDFTPAVFQLEGLLVKNLQELFYAPWLTPVLVYFYILVFQALIIGSIGVYLIQQNKALVYGSLYAILINYALAIPFYLLVPVNEVWSYAPAGVSFLMLDVFPSFETIYRPMSGLDNCFPSLHTSLSVTMALLSFRSGNKRWMFICGISAAIIVFSIFYLGIHWVTDMVAGVLLSLLASSLGLYLGKLTHAKTERVPLYSNAV